MTNFTIDFFELLFLAEACIPDRPIARSMFWDDFCNKHYYAMTAGERKKAFEWIQKNGSFDLEKEGCQLFYARFDPDNQYKVTTVYNGEKKVIEAFLHNGAYHTSKTQSIFEKYITKVRKA